MLNFQTAILTSIITSVGLLSVPAYAEDEAKVTEAREFQFGEAHQPLADVTLNKKTTLAGVTKAGNKKRATVSSIVNSDFWIYDAWVETSSDIDYDGYATTVSVSFDADTIYAEVPVYAVIYLGDANEFYPVHTTSDFFIYGESTSDEFVVETDLVTGFRPYDYDIMIELYDSQTNELVAIADHTNDADLSYVPLESHNYDVVYVEETVVEVRSHGGAIYWPALAGLLGLGVWRRLRANK